MTTTINADNITGGAVVTGDSSGVLALQTAGTTAVTITNAQKVGVGAGTPATQFSVQNASTSLGVEVDTTSGFNTGPTLRGYYRPGSAYTTLGLTGSSVVFGINDVEATRIASTGAWSLGSSGTNYGTSGQVLTSAGSGSAPTWTTPSSGALVYLATVTASNSSTVNIENAFTAYDEYVVKVTNMVSDTANTNIRMRAKFAGSYDSGSNYGLSLYTQYDANSQYLGGNPATSLAINTANLRANYPSSFEFRIHSPSAATTKSFDWQGFVYNNGATASMVVIGAGLNTTTSQLQGVQFYIAGGTVVSGTFRLYGISNS